MELRVLDTVRLSPPAPAPHASPLPLSGLDADRNALDVTFRTLRFFPPPPPPVDPHAVLPRAFEAALGLFPALAGRLGDGGRVVVVDSSSPGLRAVPLVLAESELAAADVDTDCPDSVLLDRLTSGVSDGAKGSALALEAMRFACGGVALGMRCAGVARALRRGACATKSLVAVARFAGGQWERREQPGARRPPRFKVVCGPNARDHLGARHSDALAHGEAEQKDSAGAGLADGQVAVGILGVAKSSRGPAMRCARRRWCRARRTTRGSRRSRRRTGRSCQQQAAQQQAAIGACMNSCMNKNNCITASY